MIYVTAGESLKVGLKNDRHKAGKSNYMYREL